MVKPLDANSTYSTDSVEWKRLVSEYGSGSGANLERFKNAYGGGSTLEISSSLANYNIYTMLGSPTSPVNVTLTIPNGVTVSSNSAATAALDTGNLPAGSTVTIINNGSILGAGGIGGAGANGGNVSGNPGGIGGDGGSAISLSSSLTVSIDNTNGYIFGGGGGGGGSGSCTGIGQNYAGCGGGGGAGAIVGAGGPAGFGSVVNGNPGAAGTSLVGGSGGTWPNIQCQGIGGTGGAPGSPGDPGSYTGAASGSVGPGGPAGKAISLNGNTITWTGGNDATRVKGAVN